MQIIPGFTKASTPAPTNVAPVPTREDPSVTQAKEDLRLSEKKRKGRAASMLTSGSGVSDELGSGTSYSRPQARAAQLLSGAS